MQTLKIKITGAIMNTQKEKNIQLSDTDNINDREILLLSLQKR